MFGVVLGVIISFFVSILFVIALSTRAFPGRGGTVEVLACGARCYGKTASPNRLAGSGVRGLNGIVGTLSTSIITLRRLSDTTMNEKTHCLLGRVTSTTNDKCMPCCNGTTPFSKNDVNYKMLMGGALPIGKVRIVRLPNSRAQMTMTIRLGGFVFVNARSSLGSRGHERKTRVIYS